MNRLHSSLKTTDFASTFLSRAALATCLILIGLTTQMEAQELAIVERAPAGWFLAGSTPSAYRTGVSPFPTENGAPSAFLRSATPHPDGFGTLKQTIRATEYAGRRIRLRASVSSRDVKDWAGIWMRVDRDRTMVAFDNMQDRPVKGTEEWTSHDVVLDVPTDATQISFGILLTGAGEVWMRDLSFEIVDTGTAVTGHGPSSAPSLAVHPVNLDFTE